MYSKEKNDTLKRIALYSNVYQSMSRHREKVKG